MGYKALDVNPIRPGKNVNIPVNKDVETKPFQVGRTNTTESNELILPADASIIGIRYYPSTASNAGTTAAVTINVRNGPENGTAQSIISTGTQSVLSAATMGFVNMSNLPNIENIASATEVGDLRISAVYAETGTASTAGGPWTFVVEYVR